MESEKIKCKFKEFFKAIPCVSFPVTFDNNSKLLQERRLANKDYVPKPYELFFRFADGTEGCLILDDSEPFSYQLWVRESDTLEINAYYHFIKGRPKCNFYEYTISQK